MPVIEDEEKKAIEYLQKHIIPYYNTNGCIEFLVNETLLKLIKEYQYTIAEMVQTREDYFISKDKIKDMLKQFDTVINKKDLEKAFKEIGL